MNLSALTLELVLQLKMIWVGFMILTWMMWQWRKTSGLVFVTLFGIFLAGSYALVAASTQTMFWGMTGDEGFISAIFEHQSWGRLASDFTSHALPLFYPPLYFITGGLIGLLVHFNGIGLAKVMAVVTLFIAPIIFYGLFRYWHKKNITAEGAAVSVALLLTALPFDAMFLKPYEMLSGTAIIIISSGIILKLWEDGVLTRNQWLISAASLSILFSIFYFWFILLAIALVLMFIIGPRRKELFKTWLSLAGIIFIISSWYWYPNIASFVQYGYENWQPLFFIKDDLKIFLPFLSGLSIFGSVIFILTIFTVIWQAKNLLVRVLCSLIASAYLYQLINYLVYINGGRPMQPSKGYLFFAMPAIIMIAGYGIQQLSKSSLRILAPIIIIIASLFTMPALGLDSTRLIEQIDININYKFLRTLELNALFGIKDLKDKVLLTSGMPELEARAPYQEYLTHNINLAHPALGFTRRYDFISALTRSVNSDDFYQRLISMPGQKVDGLLLFHDTNNYYLYYWLDNFPNGGREEILSFDQSLINPNYFDIKKISDEYDLIIKK